MRRIETDLMKEMRGLRKDVSLILRRQDIMVRAMVPEVRPTRNEVRAIKEFERGKSERKLKLIPLSKLS